MKFNYLVRDNLWLGLILCPVIIAQLLQLAHKTNWDLITNHIFCQTKLLQLNFFTSSSGCRYANRKVKLNLRAMSSSS